MLPAEIRVGLTSDMRHVVQPCGKGEMENTYNEECSTVAAAAHTKQVETPPWVSSRYFSPLFYTRFSLSFLALCQLLSLFSLLSMFPHCYRFMTLTTSCQYPFIVIFILFFIHSL